MNTDLETLAEALSWTCFDFTRYKPGAHPDHNRWSWRGTGHNARKPLVRQAAAELAETLNLTTEGDT